MDARITDGAARTNGRRPGHVDMITDSERPAADPSAEPPTHRVAVVPHPRAADGGGGGAANGGADGVSADTTRVPVVAPRSRPAAAGRHAPDPGPRSTRSVGRPAGGGRPAQSGRSAPLPAPDRAASRITSVPALRGDGPAPRVEDPAFRAGRGRGGLAAPPPPRRPHEFRSSRRPAPPRPGSARPRPRRAPPAPPAPPRRPPQPGPFRPAPAPPRAPSDATPRVPARNGHRDPASECVTSAIPVVAPPRPSRAIPVDPATARVPVVAATPAAPQQPAADPATARVPLVAATPETSATDPATARVPVVPVNPAGDGVTEQVPAVPAQPSAAPVSRFDPSLFDAATMRVPHVPAPARNPRTAVPSVYVGGPAPPPRTLLDILEATAARFPRRGDRRRPTGAGLHRALREVAPLGGMLVPPGSATVTGWGFGSRPARPTSTSPSSPCSPWARRTCRSTWTTRTSARRWLVGEAGVCAVIGAGAPHAGVRAPERVGPRLLGLADDAWIIFTSGSTGKPKGVAVTHRSAAAFVDAEARLFLQGEPLGPGDRVLAGLSVAFDASCEEMWLAWRHGACLVPAPSSLVNTGADLGGWLVQSRISVVSTVPTLAALWPTDELRGIRLLILGGEACPAELAHRLAALPGGVEHLRAHRDHRRSLRGPAAGRRAGAHRAPAGRLAARRRRPGDRGAGGVGQRRRAGDRRRRHRPLSGRGKRRGEVPAAARAGLGPRVPQRRRRAGGPGGPELRRPCGHARSRSVDIASSCPRSSRCCCSCRASGRRW